MSFNLINKLKKGVVSKGTKNKKTTSKKRTITKLTEEEIINLKQKLERQIRDSQNSDISHALGEHKKNKHLDFNN